MKLSSRAKNYLRIAGLGAGAIVGIALAGNREVKADVSGMVKEREAEDIDAMMRNYNETFGTKLGHSSTHSSKTN